MDNKEFKILCPYCNAPYTAYMETEFEYSMGGEETGVYDQSVSVKIFCTHCQKLIYTKG